jgi:signal transduction histidine kinase
LNLHADAPRLQQALSNLLSSAVQHGDHSVPVTLRTCGKANAVVLGVGNMGEPIPPDVLQGPLRAAGAVAQRQRAGS